MDSHKVDPITPVNPAATTASASQDTTSSQQREGDYATKPEAHPGTSAEAKVETEADADEDSPVYDEAGIAPSIAASASTDENIEPDTWLSDEGYAESTSTRYLTSIASDIRRGVEENGRLYAAYGKYQSWLPIDDEEVDFLSPLSPPSS